ncbi:CHAD domain-containing protein [Domibacillus indicus]|uniref:CHAD domain-containing protein n=1 Tax=Domibacillus indicus TaxID=1437523 RepID=UPI0018CC8DFF|nr:CHAD domain-containing protein [Domibacillus indicus]
MEKAGKEKQPIQKAGDTVMNNKLESCVLCQKEFSLLSLQDGFLCDECLNEGNRQRANQWTVLFKKRFDRFRQLCRQCCKNGDLETIHQARVTGRKIASLLQFLKVKKRHPLRSALKEIHSLLSPIREADVFLQTFEGRSGAVHQELLKKVARKRNKLQKKMEQKMPKLLKNVKQLSAAFLSDELPSLLAVVDQEQQIQSFENRFADKAVRFHHLAASHGKQSAKAVKALHRVRIQAKLLRYMYADLSERTGQDYSSKENDYKAIQSQFGEINDVQDWIEKLERYERKLNVSKKETLLLKKKWQNRLRALIKEVDIKPKARAV